MFNELKQLEQNGISYAGRLFISDKASLVSNIHKEADRVSEKRKGSDAIGTTL
jgi:adenylosuccinate synthase